MTDAWRCTLDCDVASKKNGKVARFRRGSKCGACGQSRLIGFAENSVSRSSQAEVEHQILRSRAAANRGTVPVGPRFPREVSCELILTLDNDSGMTHVEVRAIGAEPASGRNGRRRDAQNQLALVCDALERAGILANDNQLASITVQRLVQ